MSVSQHEYLPNFPHLVGKRWPPALTISSRVRRKKLRGQCQALLSAPPGRTALSENYRVPADGICSPGKRDFGTFPPAGARQNYNSFGYMKKRRQCPLLAQSRHELVQCNCLLSEEKRHCRLKTLGMAKRRRQSTQF